MSYDPDAVASAAQDIVDAATTLATAYGTVKTNFEAAAAAAFAARGLLGTERVVTAGANMQEWSRQIVGVLVQAGLAPMFEQAGIRLGDVPPITNLAEHWQALYDNGVLS